MRTMTLAELLGVGALAMAVTCCGASSSHSDTRVADGGTEEAAGTPGVGGGGGDASGAGGTSAVAGASAEGGGGNAAGAGHGGAGAGGEGGHPTTYPCGTATPLAGESSGFELCSRGYTRRTTPGTCSSHVPRIEPIEGYNPGIDQCEYDGDCSEASYGPHAHCGIREGGFAHTCERGCVEDTECDSGELCLCGEPVGRCVPADCTAGSDCAAGFDCASFDAAPGCFSTQFACQATGDRCAADGDCAGFSPNPSFCIVQDGVRVCSIAQCTSP